MTINDLLKKLKNLWPKSKNDQEFIRNVNQIKTARELFDYYKIREAKDWKLIAAIGGKETTENTLRRFADIIDRYYNLKSKI